jgi:protein subunit release factor A
MSRVKVLTITIKDCDVQTFSAGGKGGQNQNKRSMGVRVIHRASGARGEARDERSQLQNKKLAFERMANTATFRHWVRLQHAGVWERVEKELDPKNLDIEYGPFNDQA